jgi:hypothetical protein
MGAPVLASAEKIASCSVVEMTELSARDTASVTYVTAYTPGPHAVSVSSTLNARAYKHDSFASRVVIAEALTAAESWAVPSNRVAPTRDALWDCVACCVGDCVGVEAWVDDGDANCDAVDVIVVVCDCVDDCVTLGVPERETVRLEVVEAVQDWEAVLVALGVWDAVVVCVSVAVFVCVSACEGLRVVVKLGDDDCVVDSVVVWDGEGVWEDAHDVFAALSSTLPYDAFPTTDHATPSVLDAMPTAVPKPDTGTWFVTLSMLACQLTALSDANANE